MKKKKVPPCTHEKFTFEKSYVRKSSKPIDGYREVILITCNHCNKLLNTISPTSKEYAEEVARKLGITRKK